jgi:hypothetical protein
LDVLDPLVLFSRPFEDFLCKFFTIEFSGSSRELEALIDRGHGLVSEAVEDFYSCFCQREAQGSLWTHVEEVMPG